MEPTAPPVPPVVSPSLALGVEGRGGEARDGETTAVTIDFSFPHTAYRSPMGLLDWFRRKPDRPMQPLIDEWEARGKLQAEVNSLRLEWDSYREQLNRIAQRIEKRDQREAKRAAAAADGSDELVGDAGELSEVDAYRLLRTRRGR